MTLASTPKLASVCTSCSAMRAPASGDASLAGSERRSRSRSGSLYSACVAGPTSNRLGGSSSGSSIGTGSGGSEMPMTSGKSWTASIGVAERRAGSTGAGSAGMAASSGSGHSSRRRAAPPTWRTAAEERRRNAPIDAAEERAEHPLQRAAAETPVVPAEQEQQPEPEDHEPAPEGTHIDQRAPSHHQRTDDGERAGKRVGRPPDKLAQRVGDPDADVPAVPMGVHDGGQEDAERSEPEADQLGVLTAGGLLRRPLSLAQPRRHARLERPLFAATCHKGWFFDTLRAIPRRCRYVQRR